MIVHPVLHELSRRGTLQLSADGFAGTVLWDKNRHHDIHQIHFTGSPTSLDMDLTYVMLLRYPLVKSPRVTLYVQALQKLMTPKGITISQKSARGIEALLHYEGEELAKHSSVAKMVEFWYCEMGKCNMLFDQVAAIARMSYRLANRTGTDRYRKLLPTRLAEFTMCGLYETDTYH